MSNKAVEKKWEEPVDDSTEETIAEEFRFKPHRLERVQPGIKKVGVHLYLDEDVLAHFQQIAQCDGAPAWQTLVNQVLRKAVADRLADRVADKLKRKTVKKAA